jgi:hypothetical protein
MAMNSMLGFTNNHIKDMNVNGTNAVLIDWGYYCDLYIIVEIASIIDVIGAAALAAIFLVASVIGVIGGWMGMAHDCGWPSQVGNPWGF